MEPCMLLVMAMLMTVMPIQRYLQKIMQRSMMNPTQAMQNMPEPIMSMPESIMSMPESISRQQDS